MTDPISRRRFLLGAGAAGIAVAGGVAAGHWLPGASASGSAGDPPAPTGKIGPLVVITLYGGNDGLNTVVPYTDAAYRSLRPSLGYGEGEVLDLDGQFGLNPQLTQMQGLWKAGRLAVVRGVGYPAPNLSHFASMDIWQTANPADGTGAGWLGRWLDLGGTEPLQAVSVGATMPLLMRGEKRSATAVTGPTIALPGGRTFQSSFARLSGQGADRQGLAGAVALSMGDLLAARQELDALPRVAGTATGTASGEATGLAAQLGVVADMIQAGSPTRAYQVSLSSFDTHAGEKADQERLLKELDDGIGTFFAALAHAPDDRQPVVMTYSEFGRRPAENASGGTDHGAASVLFVAGAQVRGGRYYGEQPSLTRLDSAGNLVMNVDFRSVYATVVDRVLGADPAAVLGARFPTVDFI
jgi:uncharacterized protein (DUF1501 family)